MCVHRGGLLFVGRDMWLYGLGFLFLSLVPFFWLAFGKHMPLQDAPKATSFTPHHFYFGGMSLVTK